MRSALDALLKQVDPFLGTVADREPPGKPEFSGFRSHDADRNLYYDIGNNLVGASVTPRGAIRRAMIFTGVRDAPVPAPPGGIMPGVWHAYDYVNFCQEESFAFRVGEEFVEVSRTGLNQDTSLVAGAFPLTAVRIGRMLVRQLVMAPVHQGRRLPGLLVVLRVTSEAEVVATRLKVPGELEARGNSPRREGAEARFVLLDGLEEERRDDELDLKVHPGRGAAVAAFLAMGENAEDLELQAKQAASLESGKLVEDTAAFFSGRLPMLAAEGTACEIGSILRRSVHAQTVSILRARDGTPAASSWGSDTSERVSVVKDWSPDCIWMMDSFYNYLSAGLADPELWLDGVRFFLFRSLPNAAARAVWRKAKKVAKGDRRPHSLGNAVAPVVLAGTYYDLTGDGAALSAIEEADPARGKRVEFKERMHRLLQSLLKTRSPGEPMLFQSQWLSDGPARGKYHTGSNVLAWHAFKSAARLYREVFRIPRRAKDYGEIADRMAADLRKHCTVERAGERMFSEGAGSDLVHDGEESGTTIAPFLGFCPADDPALVGYKRFGASPENPFWDEIGRGINWEGCGTTTPGFMSELAGARTEWELAGKLDKLLSLADVDGQWWWWPREPKKPELIRARCGKCGWGTGVFLIQLLHNHVGITWDAPTAQLSIRPFVPWEEFAVAGLSYGGLRLDLKYRNGLESAAVEIRHNRKEIKELVVGLRAPDGTTACRLKRASPDCRLREGPEYFGKRTWEAVFAGVGAPAVSVAVAWE